MQQRSIKEIPAGIVLFIISFFFAFVGDNTKDTIQFWCLLAMMFTGFGSAILMVKGATEYFF